jgi:GNAT superfamily N-acetyltransferase
VQNRYAGDIGDFGKFGLLRELAKADPSLRLGLIWYLYRDEKGTNDGKFIDYLDPSSAKVGRQFSDCDADLYDKLKVFLAPARRSVSEFTKLGLLSSSTVYFDEPLSFSGSPRERVAMRESWFTRSLAATKDCDVVLLDPDNGIRVRMDKGDAQSGKFVYVDEIAKLLSERKTIIVYQHLDRSARAEVQLSRRADFLTRELGLPRRPTILRHRRGAGRAYYFITQPKHLGLVTRVLEALTTPPWSKHFEIAEIVSPDVFELRDADYTVSDDPARLDVAYVHAFLVTCYWSPGIPREVVERAIAGSLSFGLYDGTGMQTGFARVITDRATYAYVADVFVDEAQRGKGLGKLLMRAIMSHPDLQGLRRWSLATWDAHGLYRQFGFSELAHPERFMEIAKPDLYKGNPPV